MTQEEKNLLLKDLCARLPYGVKLYHIPTNDISILEIIGEDFIDGDIHDIIGNYKPYLFPLSSMTKEQELHIYFNTKFRVDRFGDLVVNTDADDNYLYTDISDYISLIDWLNKNHFDYRGLIPKGLAIDATGKNIY